MSTTITLSKGFLDGYQQNANTTMMNISMQIVVEMKKLAPFARPGQYPGGRYYGTPGTLAKSIDRRGNGLNREIFSSVPYAIRRNYENNLNPQTKKYVERSIDNVMRGDLSQWWRAS